MHWLGLSRFVRIHFLPLATNSGGQNRDSGFNAAMASFFPRSFGLSATRPFPGLSGGFVGCQ